MPKRLWLILLVLLVFVVISACEQHSELESSAPEVVNSSAGAEKVQHTETKPGNGELVNDEVINGQTERDQG